MSYTLDVTPDAKAQWAELGIEEQERALDEFDRLAGDFNHHRIRPDVVTELKVLRRDGSASWVFIHAYFHHAKRKLTVLGVGKG